MDMTVSKIRQLVDADTIIGKPISTPDGITVIPVSRMSIGVSAFFSASTAPDSAWSTIIASAEVPGGENTAGAEAENRIAAARARITVLFINKHHPWIDSGGA